MGRHEGQLSTSKVDLKWLDSILPHLKEEYSQIMTQATDIPPNEPDELSNELLIDEGLPVGLCVQ